MATEQLLVLDETRAIEGHVAHGTLEAVLVPREVDHAHQEAVLDRSAAARTHLTLSAWHSA